jgi:hypothetical protein
MKMKNARMSNAEGMTKITTTKMAVACAVFSAIAKRWLTGCTLSAEDSGHYSESICEEDRSHQN